MSDHSAGERVARVRCDRALIGMLLLDKPVGLSSSAALQIVRRLAGGIKAGHCGSLDPLASGMLPICLGEATRLAGELLDSRKAYRCTVRLGERSATGDAEGAIIERCAVPGLNRAAIETVLARFLGEQQQVPPMYSALKRAGQPLYRLARQGMTVERAPRAIRIDTLALLDHGAEHLELAVLCSKGTYVRVLAEDLARALGSCGRLDALRREYVEPFEHEPMVSLEQLEADARQGTAWPILPADRAVCHLPSLQLLDPVARAISQGRTVPLADACEDPSQAAQLALAAASAALALPERLWRLYDAQRRFLGLGVSDARGYLAPRRLFPHPVVV